MLSSLYLSVNVNSTWSGSSYYWLKLGLTVLRSLLDQVSFSIVSNSGFGHVSNSSVSNQDKNVVKRLFSRPLCWTDRQILS